MRVNWTAALVVVLVACASRPGPPPPAAPVAPPAGPGTSGPKTTVQQAQMAGYKIVNKHGEEMYCREQLKTGSHLRKETICLTADELEASREATKREIERMKQPGPTRHGN